MYCVCKIHVKGFGCINLTHFLQSLLHVAITYSKLCKKWVKFIKY
jgi:hypothetical protein